MNRLNYSMYIRWSDADECYIAWLPEFGEFVTAHGETYEEAAKNGREVIEMMLESIESGDWRGPIPIPFKYGGGQTITPPTHEGMPLAREESSRPARNPAKEPAGV